MLSATDIAILPCLKTLRFYCVHPTDGLDDKEDWEDTEDGSGRTYSLKDELNNQEFPDTPATSVLSQIKHLSVYFIGYSVEVRFVHIAHAIVRCTSLEQITSRSHLTEVAIYVLRVKITVVFASHQHCESSTLSQERE
jgi:hypothetical protein